MIELTLTLKMTTAQVVETSITVNNNSPIQDYVHSDDQTQPTFEMTPGFKPFTTSHTNNKNIAIHPLKKFIRLVSANIYSKETVSVIRSFLSGYVFIE